MEKVSREVRLKIYAKVGIINFGTQERACKIHTVNMYRQAASFYTLQLSAGKV